jgi:streptogramin lyase
MRVRGSVLGASLSRRAHTLPGATTMLLVVVVGLVAMAGVLGVSTAAAEITQNFQAQNSRPLDIAAGAEGDLWYTGAEAPFPCAGGVGLFEPSSDDIQPIGVECEGKNEFVGNGTNGITLGPEGDVWFTAGGGIGRIEPSATASEDFFVPPAEKAIKEGKPADLTLGGITPGSDGNLWFTEVQASTTPPANRIGRINPKEPKEVTEFMLPAGNELGGGVGGANTDNIAAGSGDTLWFAEPGSHAIGVINTEGKFLHKFEVSVEPLSIAAGAEGNMWFTDASTPYVIGRINPAGEVSEFPAPSNPTNIIEGPDSNMWFTQGGNSPEAGLGCIIPTGQIELYSVPTESGNPAGITVNKGSIWITQTSGDKLARFYPVACGAKAPPPSTTPNSGTTSTPNSGTTTPTTPTTTPKGSAPPAPPLATVLGLPPAQQCVSKRTLLVHVHAPPGQQLLSVKLSLGGKVLRAETFTKDKNDKIPPTLVDLRGLPKGTFTLTIIVKTKAGKTYRATRTYHTCVPRKHKQGKKH